MRGLASREQAHAWELRGAWAAGREIVLVLDPDVAGVPRVRGLVVRVAPTGAAAWVDDTGAEPVHVPCAAILALRRPHFHEDGVTERRGAQARREAPVPGQLPLFD